MDTDGHRFFGWDLGEGEPRKARKTRKEDLKFQISDFRFQISDFRETPVSSRWFCAVFLTIVGWTADRR